MLEKISWGLYWTVVGVLVVIYYSIVILLLYHYGLLSKPQFRSPALQKNPSPKPATPATLPERKSTSPLEDQHRIEVRMNSLIDELLQYLQDISNRSFIKEEIIMGLQVILRDYKEFSGTVYQSDISDFIKKETENYCAVELTEEEVLRVWIG